MLVPGRKNSWCRALGLALLAVALWALAAPASAQENPDYAQRVKLILARILDGRDFKPAAGCDDPHLCNSFLAQLRAGAFSVIEPVEESDRPNMTDYRRIRQKCARVDPLHLRASHHINVATRNFAMYKLEIPKQYVGGDEILVFRGQHYVPTDGARVDEAGDSRAVWPGLFVAVGLPSCRQFSNATAQEGDQRARHNLLSADDYLSEIVKIGDRYFVLNVDPIAGPNQPKGLWWYDIELWDWGPRADADLHHSRHVYTLSYRPVSVTVTDSDRLPPAMH